MSKLTDLYDNYGQSPWIDNLRRDWLSDGTLEKYLANGVRGHDVKPSIFAKTIGGSAAYDDDIANSKETDPERVFETLAVADVQNACDLLAGGARELEGGVRQRQAPLPRRLRLA